MLFTPPPNPPFFGWSYHDLEETPADTVAFMLLMWTASQQYQKHLQDVARSR